MVGLSSEFTIISFGYEYIYQNNKHPKTTHAFGLQMGYNEEFIINIFGYDEPKKKFITLTGHYSLNFGTSGSKLELGIGAGSIGEAIGVYPLIGYRLLSPKKNKFSLRVTANYPIFLTNRPKTLLIPFGINLGVNY